ncbi:MAG: PilZ domain-containing protein [Deltaproteobacteria bacterium]|nr:PilZ domain-containing protein [Deltaproteobacteria bacterium]
MTSGSGSLKPRDGARIDLRLHVSWSAGSLRGVAEASDVSPQGLRIETDVALDKGARVALSVDTGEGKPAETQAEVVWCRTHQTPTGRTVHDVGLQLATGWSHDMGKLGAALSTLFALQAESDARIPTALPARLPDGTGVELVEIQMGVLRFTGAEGTARKVDRGAAMTVEFDVEGSTHRWQGRVTWLAEGAGEGERGAGFGLTLSGLDGNAKALLERIRRGQARPGPIRLSA